MHTHVIHPSIHLSINPSIHPSVCCLHSLDLVGKSQNVHDYVISCTVASCYRIIQSHFRGSPQSRLCTCSVPTTGSAGCYRESPVCMPLLNPPPSVDCHYPLLAGQDRPQSQGLSWSAIWPLCIWWYCVPSSGEIYNTDVHMCYMYCMVGVIGDVSAL